MTRDYSQFMPSLKGDAASKPELSTLQKLGWRGFFSQQTTAEALVQTPPVRVSEVHRNGLHIVGDGIDQLIDVRLEATVGDWLLYDADTPSESVILERSGVFERRAPGRERKKQLIAANVDTVFIVTSCNRDFNIARLERYVALAFEAQATPVILLTKADLCDDVTALIDEARTISDRVVVEALNALSDAPRRVLGPWCKPGQTLAFMGSSGVGKSTLVNALFEREVADTGAVRVDDSKGRHTTTRRELHFTAEGVAVLDTPGMRELQLTDVEAGIADVFADLAELAEGCHFRDCKHESEPKCAVLAALERGEIDAARMERWKKLALEEQFNSASLSERRANDKAFHKMVRAHQKHNRK